MRRGVDAERNFRRVFDFYYPALHGFFRRKLFSSEEAHDLTQETFLRVYTKIEQFRGDAPFEAWLWQIAVNLYRKHGAARQTGKRAGETVSLDETKGGDETINAHPSHRPTPLDGILRAEQREQIRAAVAELPEQMRRCIELRVFQDLSYGEIAVLMRISPQTVKAHLFQARQRLRGRSARILKTLNFSEQ